MSLKVFKSYTKSSRGTVLVNRKNLWKGKALKKLTFGKNSTGGRNNLGRILQEVGVLVIKINID